MELRTSLGKAALAKVMGRLIESLEGVLLYRSNGAWFIKVLDSNFIEKFYRLPVQPLDSRGKPIPAGSYVSLVNRVRSAFLDAGGYAEFFSNCSYGKMVFDRQAFTVVSTVVPCSLELVNKCDEDVISTAAQAQLQPGFLNSGLFTQLVYVLPDGMLFTCNWVGLAELPGTQSWFTPDSQGIFSKGTVMQELLHNFGLYHGWKDGVEYMDDSTSMGFGDSCPSAPELRLLGWATPLAQLNSSSLPVGVYMTYTLTATYVKSSGVMIWIQPDWLGSLYNSESIISCKAAAQTCLSSTFISCCRNIYLALRGRAAGDQDLLQDYNGKVSMHEVIQDMDNNGTLGVIDDPKVSITGVLRPSASVALFNYKVHILTGALSNSGTSITIKICRFTESPAECEDVPS
ncbi:hypothetical protein VOLCADRAFT_91803 [Volvox carteri f. nagariensis]|uniref:Peptidase M11 gametolysin domain-containing protein n=1 Tax=Volvox carteri f. nagariensis TaxID=3068 RepID=D8TXZ9_VOLCA|nr:uncharacterized protein VOLCADRAFT_91803 [Volvox carteri f. nagariensis]EFJ47461.1 hypothetical protein VOLCADRAFT_91803 [Volvox carteri f. nagariensis]|eukprot:XP_002951285.1 hypothetical protein VOLCADRAFT_91803 [Volvox carteri f. nagariensis]